MLILQVDSELYSGSWHFVAPTLTLPLPATASTAEDQALADDLVIAGVEATTAQSLATDHVASVRVWLDVLRRGMLRADNPGAYLARVVAKETLPPAKYRKALGAESRAVATPVTPASPAEPLPPEQPMPDLTEDEIAGVVAAMTVQERSALNMCDVGGRFYHACLNAAYRRQQER